jgi:hypothetical protein
MLALFSLIVFWIWLAILAAYAVLSLTASLNSARRSEWKLLPVLPAVVGCYHFGYGYGFCRGLWDFVICRKGGRPSFGSLTRIS